MTVILNQLVILFALISIGYLLNRIDIIDNMTNKKLSSLVVYVTAPALIIAGMSAPDIVDSDINIVQIVIISIGCYVFLYLMSLMTPKLLKIPSKDIGIYQFMVIFSNVGFMGFPVIESIYGKGAIIYAALFNLPFYFLIYTLGIYLISLHGDKYFRFNWRLLANTGVIAVFIGLFFFLTKIPLPIFLYGTVGMLGDLTTPLAMLIIGSSLANIPLKSVLLNIKIYLFSILKLIVYPVVIWIILSNILDNSLLIGVSVVIAGMPVAANAVMLSKEFDGNEEVASEGVFLSTLLSIITIPLLVFILTR
ncbi:MAG: AEC family transporter [Eubacteriales bacterium]